MKFKYVRTREQIFKRFEKKSGIMEKYEGQIQKLRGYMRHHPMTGSLKERRELGCKVLAEFGVKDPYAQYFIVSRVIEE